MWKVFTPEPLGNFVEYLKKKKCDNCGHLVANPTLSHTQHSERIKTYNYRFILHFIICQTVYPKGGIVLGLTMHQWDSNTDIHFKSLLLTDYVWLVLLPSIC